jgi:DNA N-6-adenine-methyltransferase (Dam).
MNTILFSKNSDNWRTPENLYKKYIEDDYFDPCPLNSNFDGLKIDWKEKNFVNPPYSKIKLFVNKSIEEHKKGKEVILLIPARTDTLYFRKLIDYGVNVTFITGRLHFNNSNSAPFPSCLIRLTGDLTKCYWRNREKGE